MDNTLLAMLLGNGLVQFGRFEREGQVVPMLLNLELLPSYPETLQLIADQTALVIGKDVERLVCTADSIPLGTALSLRTQIPLVYSRGKGEAPVYDLVGAYDVGHPAVLVMNILQSVAQVQNFVSQAKKVGLHIHQVLAITDDGSVEPDNQDYNIRVLMPLREMIDNLEQQGHLAQGQASAVRNWMQH